MRTTIAFPNFLSPLPRLEPFLLQRGEPSTSIATGPLGRNAVRHTRYDFMAIASPKKKEELARQFKINPEINTRLEAFMKAEPGLVQFVKELPREQLERKFLFRRMQDQEQKQGYTAKVKAWLEGPEQADLVKSMKATLSPNMKPETQ